MSGVSHALTLRGIRSYSVPMPRRPLRTECMTLEQRRDLVADALALRRTIIRLSARLKPFPSEHYAALYELQTHVDRALEVLTGRKPDHTQVDLGYLDRF